MTDHSDEYAEGAESADRDLREIRGAIFDDTLQMLSVADPVCVRDSVTVQEAVAAMIARHQAGVFVVDGSGRLTGIFTERDVLLRVVGQMADPQRTAVGSVMTRAPETLTRTDRVAYALHCMAVAGYRTLPVVDQDGHPVGVVTVSDVIRWLASLFPEAVLNLRPGDQIKNPHQVDAG
jgi:CBS domain-containing protein